MKRFLSGKIIHLSVLLIKQILMTQSVQLSLECIVIGFLFESGVRGSIS